MLNSTVHIKLMLHASMQLMHACCAIYCSKQICCISYDVHAKYEPHWKDKVTISKAFAKETIANLLRLQTIFGDAYMRIGHLIHATQAGNDFPFLTRARYLIPHTIKGQANSACKLFAANFVGERSHSSQIYFPLYSLCSSTWFNSSSRTSNRCDNSSSLCFFSSSIWYEHTMIIFIFNNFIDSPAPPSPYFPVSTAPWFPVPTERDQELE